MDGQFELAQALARVDRDALDQVAQGVAGFLAVAALITVWNWQPTGVGLSGAGVRPARLAQGIRVQRLGRGVWA